MKKIIYVFMVLAMISIVYGLDMDKLNISNGNYEVLSNTNLPFNIKNIYTNKNIVTIDNVGFGLYNNRELQLYYSDYNTGQYSYGGLGLTKTTINGANKIFKVGTNPVNTGNALLLMGNQTFIMSNKIYKISDNLIDMSEILDTSSAYTKPEIDTMFSNIVIPDSYTKPEVDAKLSSISFTETDTICQAQITQQQSQITTLNASIQAIKACTLKKTYGEYQKCLSMVK